MRRTLLALALAGVTLAATVPAQATQRAVVGQIDAKFGSLGDGVYNATGIGQTKVVRVRPGHTVKVSFQVQNDASVADLSPLISGDGNSSPFSLQYKVGSTDWTTEIEAGTYDTGTLFATLEQNLTLFVKAKPSASHGELHIFTITALSSIGKGIKDVIRVKARVR
jgi:hypothetical protein